MYKILILLLLICSCGTKTSNPPRDTTNVVQELGQFKQRVELIRAQLPLCQYTPDFVGVSKDTCLAEGTGSGDADTMLFAGLLCLSGESIGCETARLSFGANGQPHRSPARLDEMDFSRDMLMGVMAYLVGTKDVETAQRFITWMYNNHRRLCFDSCDMTPATWGTLGEVWKYLGLQPTDDMKVGMYLDDLTEMAASYRNDVGYTLHLVAVHVFLRQATGSNTTTYARVAEILVQRDPTNPFFQWLHGELSTSIKLALEQAQYQGSKSEWTLERNHRNNSVGWEWIFLYNIMLNCFSIP